MEKDESGLIVSSSNFPGIKRIPIRKNCATKVNILPPDITPEQLSEMSQRIGSFKEDWNAPGMEDYDKE